MPQKRFCAPDAGEIHAMLLHVITDHVGDVLEVSRCLGTPHLTAHAEDCMHQDTTGPLPREGDDQVRTQDFNNYLLLAFVISLQHPQHVAENWPPM